MKNSPNLYLSAVALLSPLFACAQIVPFYTDFDSETVGDTTAANPSEIDGFRGNFPAAVVRDSSVNAPFGADNQYIQFGGDGVSFVDGSSQYSARAIVTGASTSLYTSSVVKMSFDYYQAKSSGWGSHIGIGTGDNPWVPDLSAPLSLFAVSFDDGNVGLGQNTTIASGSLPTFSTFTPYRITYYMNWTGAAETLAAPDGGSVTLGDKQMALWMEDLGTNSISSTVILDSGLATTSTYISMVFRNFNSTLANQNVLYLDNLEVTAVPEPETMALVLGAMAAVCVGIRRRKSCTE